MTDLTESGRDWTDEFVELVEAGKTAWERAGELLVRALDRDPLAYTNLLEKHPDLTEEVLSVFERIGRKQTYYRCWMSDRPGVKALRRCPYSEQVRYSTNGIPLLLLDAKSPTDHLLMQPQSMTPAQARQAIARDHVRNLAEQRAYLESSKIRPKTLDVPRGYTIQRGRVVFHAPCTVTLPELARLLAEATAAK